MSTPRQSQPQDITQLGRVRSAHRDIFRIFCEEYLILHYPTRIDEFGFFWQKHLNTPVDQDKFNSLWRELTRHSLFDRFPVAPQLKPRHVLQYLQLTTQYCEFYRLDLQEALFLVFDNMKKTLACLSLLQSAPSSIETIINTLRQNFALFEIFIGRDKLEKELEYFEEQLAEAYQHPTETIRVLQLVAEFAVLQKSKDEWARALADPAKYGGCTVDEAKTSKIAVAWQRAYTDAYDLPLINQHFETLRQYYDDEHRQEIIAELQRNCQFANDLMSSIDKLLKVKKMCQIIRGHADEGHADGSLRYRYDKYTAAVQMFSEQHTLLTSQPRPDYKTSLADILPRKSKDASSFSDDKRGVSGALRKIKNKYVELHGSTSHITQAKVGEVIAPDSRQKILAAFQTRTADCASQLHTLKAFTVAWMSDRPTEQTVPNAYWITRQDAYVLMRKAICIDAESTASFEALWQELTSTPDDQLAKKQFTPHVVAQPKINTMLQQVPALYCRVYQRELQSAQQQLLIRANESHSIAETASAAEDTIVADAKNVEKRIQACQKINDAISIYKKYLDEFDALDNAICAAEHVISEVDVDELTAQYESYVKLFQEGAICGNSSIFFESEVKGMDEKREIDLKLDVEALNKKIRELEGRNCTFAAECETIAEYENQIQHLQKRVDELARDDSLDNVNVELWGVLQNGLAKACDDQTAEFNELNRKKQALQKKREERELALGDAAMQLPRVLSAEKHPESKNEKDFKGDQESKRGTPTASAIKLKPIDFVQSLMPTQQVVEQCATAVPVVKSFLLRRDDGRCLRETAEEVTDLFQHYHVMKDESDFEARIKRLRERNVELQILKNLKPHKSLSKAWIVKTTQWATAIVVGICVACVVSNPIGWSIAAQFFALCGLCCCLYATYSCTKKINAHFKRNKLLEKNNKPEYIQAMLETQDDALEKKSTCLQTHTTTKIREMLIEHSMLVESLNPTLMPSLRRNHVEDCALLRDETNAYKSRMVSDIWYGRGGETMRYNRRHISGYKHVPSDHDQFETALLPAASHAASPAA